MNLDSLNSGTKYPSILTYHKIGKDGLLSEEINLHMESPCIGTEKVDGTNARLILIGTDDKYLIGTREDLICDQDGIMEGLIIDPLRSSVINSLVPIANRINRVVLMEYVPYDVIVLYFEVYGGSIGSNAKQYTLNRDEVGYRLFDVCGFMSSQIEGLDKEIVSKWRDKGGQIYLNEDFLISLAQELELELTPRLVSNLVMPNTLVETYELLKSLIPNTNCKLSDEGKGKAEGLVIRGVNRNVIEGNPAQIVKVRYKDYEKVLRKMKIIK